MNAIASVTGCLISVLAGGGLATAVSSVEDALSAKVRHRVASVSFWFVASLPLTAALFAGVLRDRAFLAWAGTAGPMLPDTLPAQDWMIVLARMVLVAMAAWALFGTVRLLTRLRQLLALGAGSVQGKNSELPIALADVPGPLLIGYRAPVVVLPRSAVAHPPAVVEALRRHEEAHARRRDNWRLLAEHLVLTAMPWCAPLRALHDKTLAAREELCDAWALRGADDATRAVYARALLDAIRTHSMPFTAVATMAGPLPAVRRRLRAILDTPSPMPRMPWRRRIAAASIASIGIAAAVVVLMAGSGLETMAGINGLSLRFVPLRDRVSGDYHMSTWGGPRVDARHDIEPGNYKVSFARDSSGGWIITTVPMAGSMR